MQDPADPSLTSAARSEVRAWSGRTATNAPRAQAGALRATPRGEGRATWIALGLGLAAAWVVHDLAIFSGGGEVLDVVRVLGPRSAIVVLLAGLAAAGFHALPRTLAFAALATFAVAALAEVQGRWRILDVGRVRFLFAMCFGLWLGTRVVLPLVRRLVPRHLSPRESILFGSVSGVALGLGSRAAMSWLRFDALPFVSIALVLGAVGGGIALAFERPARRLALAAASLALAFVPSWRAALRAAALPRPDLAPPAVAARSEAPNVVFVVLDTVRADHLSCYGHDRRTTPNLDTFAEQHATRYTTARSTSSYTLSSHASLLTGLFPAQHGATVGGPAARAMRPQVTTLAERLRGGGYQTAAIVSNVLYLNSVLGFERGFEHFDERVGTEVGNYFAVAQLFGAPPGFGHKYREAEIISDLAVRWLREERREDEPFFLFLNYLDAHSPYAPPAPFDDAFEPLMPRDPVAPDPHLIPLIYDRELAYLDHHLQRVFDELEAAGVFGETLVVVTSDHGEAFGEHGIHTHCWTLYEELVHVPLLVKPAGGRDRPVDERQITGPEVHDLVLRELGLPVPRAEDPPEGLFGEWYPWPLYPSNVRLGRSLQRDLSLDLVSWVRGSVKTVVDSAGKVEAFDLKSDPDEAVPLQLSSAEVEAARAEARQWWASHPDEREEGAALDPELRKRLAALGYGG